MNPEIGYTKKYDTQTRNAISDVIRREWQVNKDKYKTAEEFGKYMEGVLNAQGFKSPTGGNLTPRGVRFQVFQAGIRFARGLKKGTKLGPRVKKVEQKRKKKRHAAPPVLAQAVAQPGSSMLQKVVADLKRVVSDPSLNDSQRMTLVKAYLEIAA
jgi:hypothetical protein